MGITSRGLWCRLNCGLRVKICYAVKRVKNQLLPYVNYTQRNCNIRWQIYKKVKVKWCVSNFYSHTEWVERCDSSVDSGLKSKFSVFSGLIFKIYILMEWSNWEYIEFRYFTPLPLFQITKSKRMFKMFKMQLN